MPWKSVVRNEETWPFNPPDTSHATLGAANAGLDKNPKVYDITRLESPPSLLDIQQQKVKLEAIDMPLLTLIGIYFAFTLVLLCCLVKKTS